jgi:formylglycine-generating enzyme required for sulfatase activity
MTDMLCITALVMLVSLFGYAQDTTNIGIKWVFVQGGPTEDFNISATEVTFDQYDMFCEATGYVKPKEEFGRGKQPVINVNLADAVAYCTWASQVTGTTIRLPEENEWEYAAQGGSRSKKYEFSGSNKIKEVAWYDGNSGKKTHEVATKKANELGIYDMSGNVWEWCGTEGSVRGGSYRNEADNCLVSYRNGYDPGDRFSSLGFRVIQIR